MKPVDDIYIYIYSNMAGWCTRRGTPGGRRWVLEGLLDRRARLARLMRQPSFAHYAMVRAREREVYVHSRAISESVPHIRVFLRALSREISESVPHIRVVLARLARLTGRPSFTHHAMARARERSEILDARARERGTEIPESGTSGPHTRSDVDSPSYPSHSCPSHSYPSRTHGPF